MKKHYFLLWMKQCLFPYLYYEIIFYSPELFDCAANFKTLLGHFYIFKHGHKSYIKGAIFELRSNHLFWDQPYKKVYKVKYQAFNFTDALSFTSIFKDFGHNCLNCFLHSFL